MDAHHLLRRLSAVELDGLAAEDADAEHMLVLVRFVATVARWEAGPWRRWAACRTVGTDEFHRRTTATAVATCRTCDVLHECRTWVMSLPSDVDGAGVAGGMTAVERRALRRQGGAQAA